MVNKTINCQDCTGEFTYDENPKYPRKYCLNCSAKRKASFENKGNIVANVPLEAPKPVKNGNTAMYTSYAKDLFISLENELKGSIKERMNVAIALVKQAQKEF